MVPRNSKISNDITGTTLEKEDKISEGQAGIGQPVAA